MNGVENRVSSSMSSRLRWLTAGAVLCVATSLLLVAGSAQAAPGCEPSGEECPPFLGSFGEFGQGAGQFTSPSIASDPVTGHIFVGGFERINEFDSTGDFLKAWGWGIRDGAAEPQVCTTQTGCQQGSFGGGPGEMFIPSGLALDNDGNVWALEASYRIQQFTQSGEFVLMAGGEVNKTKVAERKQQEDNSEPVTVTEAEENLCTAASGDVCGAAVEGAGKGEFGLVGFFDPLEVGPDGTVYVGDPNRVQEFDEAGHYLGEIPLPGAGKTESLTVSPTGRLYVISENVKEQVGGAGNFTIESKVVREIGPAGEELDRLTGSWLEKVTPKDPVAIAADSEGNVYVAATVVDAVPGSSPPKLEYFKEVVAFDDEGDLIGFESDRAGFGRATDKTELSAVATNVVGDGSGKPGEVLVGHGASLSLMAAYVSAYGTPFEVKEAPPSFETPFATEVSSTDAVVEAQINPHFTTDTTYQVQYGTAPCSAGGCGAAAPVIPAQLEGADNVSHPTDPVLLSDLSPATTYHYRFVAQNGAGGPVVGPEGTFRTYSSAPPLSSCPNDPLRTGPAANLPDCRGYEMVSPLDKEGGELYVLPDVPNYAAELNQGAPDGNAFTYSSYRAFADPTSAPYTSQYLARRDPASGWSSEQISPPRERVLRSGLFSQFKSFAENLSSGWLVTDSEPTLAPGAVPGFSNLYRRDNGSGAFETQCPVAPPQQSVSEFNLEPQGASTDGSHLLIRANDRLTPDAAPIKNPQLYECVDDAQLRLVSVLPDGQASPTGGAAGVAVGVIDGSNFRESLTDGAISSNGSRIFWTAPMTNDPSHSGDLFGALYVRFSGQLSVEIAPANARFRTASPDGTRAIYTVNDQLFEASIGNGSSASDPIAGEVEGLMGTSEDTKLLYFVSREDLDGDGPGQVGKANLYLYRAEGGSYAFIAELSAEDAREGNVSPPRPLILTPINKSPYRRSARISPDGLHAVFASSAPLTGYDNTDLASGKADAEVFRYDATADELLCLSCNPSGARPRGSDLGPLGFPYWVAATIPGWAYQHHGSRALSEDGSRVFFEAEDALALADTNGTRDVYQWEEAGAGSCAATSPTYSPAAKGCIDLISSGKSPEPSELIDASTNGSDVFFKTSSSLFASDPGQVDLYDARIGGGFAPPPPPPAACEGDACQPPAQAPLFSSPSSSSFRGASNAGKNAKAPKRCRQAANRRARSSKSAKGRCPKPHRQTKQTNRNRRTGR